MFGCCHGHDHVDESFQPSHSASSLRNRPSDIRPRHTRSGSGEQPGAIQRRRSRPLLRPRQEVTTLTPTQAQVRHKCFHNLLLTHNCGGCQYPELGFDPGKARHVSHAAHGRRQLGQLAGVTRVLARVFIAISVRVCIRVLTLICRVCACRWLCRVTRK